MGTRSPVEKSLDQTAALIVLALGRFVLRCLSASWGSVVSCLVVAGLIVVLLISVFCCIRVLIGSPLVSVQIGSFRLAILKSLHFLGSIWINLALSDARRSHAGVAHG